MGNKSSSSDHSSGSLDKGPFSDEVLSLQITRNLMSNPSTDSTTPLLPVISVGIRRDCAGVQKLREPDRQRQGRCRGIRGKKIQYSDAAIVGKLRSLRACTCALLTSLHHASPALPSVCSPFQIHSCLPLPPVATFSRSSLGDCTKCLLLIT